MAAAVSDEDAGACSACCEADGGVDALQPISATAQVNIRIRERELRFSAPERHLADDTLALANCDDVVYRRILDDFGGPARPADFQPLRPAGLAETEVRAKIVLCQVAGSGLHFADLPLPSSR